MPFYNDRTSMGGEAKMFGTTCWTQIVDSKTSCQEKEQLIINDLISRYWKPVYCYLRRKGQDNESAKDLTQGFFQEIVLGRDLIQRADKSKGKFRTFLLTALDRYAINVYEKETAQKRKPKGQLFQLDDIDMETVPETTPEESFHYAWLSELLEQVLSEVEQEYISTGKETHWKVFSARLLEPITNNSKPPSLPDICKEYDIKTETIASNMIGTVKRRLRNTLERCLKRFVTSDSDIQEEIEELLNIFS